MILTPPAPRDWEPSPDSTTYPARLTPRGALATMTLRHVTPGHRIRLTLDLRAEIASHARGVLILEEDTEPLTNWSRRTYTLDTIAHTETITLTASGTNALTVHAVTVEDLTLTRTDPHPCDTLALLAYIPRRDFTAFTLGRDRLSRAALTRARAPFKAFTLGRDRLGSVRLYAPGSEWEWQDVISPSTSIQITRGPQSSGPVMAAQVGTLTARAVDDWDPRALGLQYGTPIMAIYTPTREPLFTGHLSDMAVTPSSPGERTTYTASLTAVDAVARLAAITRYGARSTSRDGSGPWSARVRRVMASAPSVEYEIREDSTALMAPSVWETTMTAYLDALAASVAGYWIVTREGTVEISSQMPTGPARLELTDAAPTSLDRDRWSYTAIEVDWSASQVISQIEATTHNAAPDDKGEWRADDVTTVVTDEISAYTWNGAAARVDLLVPPSSLDSAARALLRRASEYATPSKIELIAAHASGPRDRAAHMARAAALDPLTPVMVTSRGENTRALTCQITHEITPLTWKTTLTLTPQETE